MSDKSDPVTSEDPVFYVDKEGEDFTFYLDREKEDTLIAFLRQRLKAYSSSRAVKEMFSFSEKIAVKNLMLSEDSLKPDTNFWALLRSPKRNSAHHYLLNKLKIICKSSKTATSSLQKLKRGSFNNEDKKNLLRLIVQALNAGIEEESLETKAWVKRKLGNNEEALIRALPNKAKRKKWRNRLFLEGAFLGLIKKTQAGRGLICFSHVGRYLSVTFRKLEDDSGYEAKKYRRDKQVKNRKGHLFSLGEYCKLAYEEVFARTDSGQNAHGLLVVTGSTNSAKSEIARGLIHLYLSKKEGTRKHHLVTFEDPVEKFYADQNKKGHHLIAVELSRKSRSDYTPRQKDKDVAFLKDCLTDALRQTPAVVFVGEIREKEEWEVLLDFAATGHLIVTTAHAGSLVEAMHKIFEARDVNTPADRSEIANKLLALIHLRSDRIAFSDKEETTNALFPALWRRTERGVAALTSDGLASLLPHRSSEDKGKDAPSCLGRRWFVERLIKNAVADLKKAFGSCLEEPFGKSNESMKIRAYKKATEWDLEGV